MKIKVNDIVKVIAGKDRDKTGKVLHVIAAKNPRAKNKIVIEGLNLKYKHIRPKSEREKGQRIMFPYPIDISNTALVCPKCGQKTRVGYQKTANQNPDAKRATIKQRICKKCQAAI